MCDERKKIRRKKKTKKLSQFLKSHISGTREAMSLKFGMWSTEVGGSVHNKIRLVSSRQHRAMEVRKLRFLSSCQYTHGRCAPASWAARHTTVCLDICEGVGVSTAKSVLFQGSTELRKCEYCVFFLPVNILTGVARWLLGPHDTQPCVLIYVRGYQGWI